MGWLVIAQVTLSVVLVVAAGLFIGSFTALANRQLGLEPDRVLVVTVDPKRTNVDPGQRLLLYERVRESVLALPTVADAAISHLTPVGGGGLTPPLEVSGTSIRDKPSAPQLIPADGDVCGNLVSPRWFATFGTQLTAGREFVVGDRHGAPGVAIVNETFARRFFGKGNPLGQTITVYPNTSRALSAQIVGVAADAIYASPRELVPPTWYMPIEQFAVTGFPFTSVRLSVRAKTGSPDHLTRSVAEALSAVNPQLTLTFRPLAQQIQASLTRERLLAQLAGFLGGLALLLAGLGLYGVTAHAVSCRRTELAIRMALGAVPRRVIGLVLMRVWLLVGAGIVAGTAISVWASRFVGALIYGLEPRDPMTLAGSVFAIVVVAGFAVLFPARRAVRVDPVAVLREG